MTQSIQTLCDTIMQRNFSFADFAAGVKKLGVERVTVDFVRKEHVFYFKDGSFYVHALDRECEFVIAEMFDREKVKSAIHQFDRSMITPHEFHTQLTAAGVLSATGFFLDHCGIYLGQHCNFYLEEWAPEFC